MGDPAVTSSPRARADADRPSVAAWIPSLLDAGLSEVTLPETLTALAGWWGTHAVNECLGIGVETEFGRRVDIVVYSGESLRIVRSQLLGDISLRDAVCGSLPTVTSPAWYPCGDGGRVIGGIAVVAASASPPPSEWIDVTARLLAAARQRERRLQDAKLAAMAEFAAGAGHEINNPLGSIVGRVQLLARDESHPERRRLLATIGAQALRIRDMIGDAMLFARPPEPDSQPQPLVDAIADVTSRFAEEFHERRLRLSGDRDPQTAVLADAVQLRVVLSELLCNAAHAAPDESEIEINVRTIASGPQSIGIIEVRDHGPGLTETEQRHLFDPFFSGRQAGRGLGFGLSKCWRIVTMHGGRLHLEHAQPGVRAIVYWPAP